MKERIITIFLLLLAGLTIWAITAELPKKNYARPASDFAKKVRGGSTSATSPSVADEVVRLHILADSDSERDQAIKLALRDILLPHLNAAALGASTKAEALDRLTAHCAFLTETANTALSQMQAGYTATVTVERTYFPIRIYGSQTYLSANAVIFPPGYYDSVQVVLGSGTGHNWWCLAYPSLCFIDATYDYIPKDSELYQLKIGTVKQSGLEQLFYGEEISTLLSGTRQSESTEQAGEEIITLYFGSKLWELLKQAIAK